MEADEANYEGAPGSFESAMTSGTLVTWMPEGYRTVKHILVIPDESVLTPYTQAKSELDSLQTELDSLNSQLLEATDDDAAEGEEAARPRGAPGADRRAGGRHRRRAGGACPACRGCLGRRAGHAGRDPLPHGTLARTSRRSSTNTARIPACRTSRPLPWATMSRRTPPPGTRAFRDAAMLLSNVGDVSEPVLGMSGVHIIPL